MIRVVLTAILFSVASSFFAQDVIFRKSGENINCLITKIDSAKVFFDLHKDGETLSSSMSRDSVQKMEFGTSAGLPTDSSADSLSVDRGAWGYRFYQGAERITAKEFVEVLSSNKQALTLYKRARLNETFASILAAGGSFLIGYTVGGVMVGAQMDWKLFGGGCALIIGSVPLYIAGEKDFTNALDEYNGSLKSPSSYSPVNLNVSFMLNGASIRLRF